MDNFNEQKNSPINDDFDSAALDEELGKLISLDENSKTEVSHSPLSIGGVEETSAEKIKSLHIPKLQKKAAVAAVASQERITGVRTFFTKLHAGAIEFLDGQITEWLKNNPKVVIKRTNTATGEIQGKKTEPSIVVTVWY
ncbi:MAG: hypothetical protein KAS69_00670 [Planctomycetes bacterium]|nr:hypothetical protein [Planctomycetota bacterium]